MKDFFKQTWEKIQKHQYSWVIIGLAAYTILYWVYAISTRFETDIVVDREIFQGGRKVNNNLISSRDGRIFQVQNNALVWFFSSAEVLASLEDGKKYRVKGYGKRIPSLGMYPQITKIVKKH